MSNLSDIMEVFSEAKLAMDRIPDLQRRVDDLTFDNDSLHHTITDRELSILGYKREIDDLLSRLRSMEVERDSYGFRELEALEALHIERSNRTKAADLLDEAYRLMNPPTPEQPKATPPVDIIAGSTYSPVPTPTPTIPEPVVEQPKPVDVAWSFDYPDLPTPEVKDVEAAPTASGPTAEPTNATSGNAEPPKPVSSDPEPYPTYSYEWYAWRNRQVGMN